MTEKWKDFIKNKNNLVIITLAGILLMVIALPVDNKKTSSVSEKTTNNTGSLLEEEGSAGIYAANETADMESYAARLEEKLEDLLEKMEGAGKVKVIITLRSSVEKIVEKDAPVVRSNTTEADSEGGTRTVNTMDAGESTVYTSEGNLEEPYVVKIISPEVEGVLVLAEGAGSGTVSKDISDAVQVLFDIEAHRVKVIKMDGTK
ncbi:MAG: stage III sporulation protein AG [Lachnospiraceae bacterium]